MTDSSSAWYHASQPASIMPSPAIPTNCASGWRDFSSRISPAPSVSPDLSPATNATRSGRTDLSRASGTAACTSADDASRTISQRLYERLEFRMPARARDELVQRFLELQSLSVYEPVGLAQIAQLL